MLYTRKKKDLSTQAGRKSTKTNESITIFTCFPNSHKYTFKKYRRWASDFLTSAKPTNTYTKWRYRKHKQKDKKMPRHHVGAILTFLNVSAVLCFLCSYDLFENQFVFLFECKYNTNNWFKSNISLFLRKKSRIRLRYLLLFLRTKQGNYSAPILSWVVTLILWVNVYY